MHIVCLSLASLIQLVSLNERAGKWVVLLELEVSGSLIVAKSGGDSEVLRSSIEDNLSWLRVWRAHVHGSHVDGVVSAGQRHLKVDIRGVVLGRVSLF